MMATGSFFAYKRQSQARKSPRTPGQILGPIFQYALLIFLSIVFLLPFYLMLRNGFATEQEIRLGGIFPSGIHFENLNELFTYEDVPFVQGLLNSTWVALLGTAGQVLVAALAGYGLARIPYRWADIVFYAVLATMMIPGAVTFVPTYLVVNQLGWLGTLQGVIVPGLFNVFSTFMFRQFFLSFPLELEEAAQVDGLHYWGIFWRVVVPNSLPIFAALAVVNFIGNWNSFLWPLVASNQDENAMTVQVVLSTFQTAQTINVHLIFLGALISVLPLVLIFLFLQRYIVQGYVQSGLKG